MKKYFLVASMTVILSLCLVVFNISFASKAAEAGSADEIVFAIVVPLSGLVVFLGIGPNRGHQMAVDDINASGGLNISGKKGR